MDTTFEEFYAAVHRFSSQRGYFAIIQRFPEYRHHPVLIRLTLMYGSLEALKWQLDGITYSEILVESCDFSVSLIEWFARSVNDTTDEQLKMVRYILDLGASPNVSFGGRSVLRTAIAYGHAAIAQLLLEYGADVNDRSSTGRLLIHDMARCPRILPLLVRHGAKVDEEVLSNVTPSLGAELLALAARHSDATAE